MKKSSILLSLLISIIVVVSTIFDVSADQIQGFDYDNYYELEYIESSGTQYINTGVSPNANLYVDMYFTPTILNSSNEALVGWGNDTGSGYRGEILINADNNPRVYSNNGSFNLSNVTVNSSTKYHLIYNQSSNSRSLSVNGVSSNFSASAINVNYLWLFYYRAGSTPYYGKYKIYSCNIINNNVSVRNYIPAERKSDNAIGLYDIVNNTFVSNSGTGAFVGGPRIAYNYRTVTADIDPAGSGSVQGLGTYLEGSTVTLAAVPNEGYRFDHWFGGSTDNPRSLLVGQYNINVTAYFVSTSTPVNEYTITTNVNPSGSGSVTGGGTYEEGTNISLEATPNTGYVFDSWSTGSTANPLTLQVNQDLTITANFTPVQSTTTYTISTVVSPTNAGSVSGGGTYAENTVISLTAVANTGYVFDHWSSGSNSNPLPVTVTNNATYTAFFVQEETPSTSFVPWTDDNDRRELKEITSQYEITDFRFYVHKRTVTDGFEVYGTRMNFDSSYSSHRIGFTGTYYDNTVTGITQCLSSSSTYNVTEQYDGEVVTIRPYVMGSLSAGDFGELHFGIDVTDVTQVSPSQATTTQTTNTTQACGLMGFGSNDGTLDEVALQQLGYTKKTITYNNGSLAGYTATFYVPGDEQLSFSSDDLIPLIESISLQIVNNTQFLYHTEYEFGLLPRLGKLMPKYGYMESNAFIGTYLADYPDITLSDVNLNLIPTEGTYITGDNHFMYTVNDNTYTANDFKLYWNNTENPVWKFKDNTKASILNWDTGRTYLRTYGTSFDFLNAVAMVRTENVEEDSQLVVGNRYYPAGSISMFKVYELNDNSLLNRFNQLGEFLNNWFTRIYNSVSNITGGSESNDITNNIIEDNDINVDVDLDLLIDDLKDKDNDIDLTLPEFQITQEHLNGIQSVGTLAHETFKSFTDNGLGIVIVLPLILAIVGLIL